MSNPDAPKADTLSDLIATLQAEAGLGKPRSPPPVHLWNPACCGDIGLEIRRDGSWWQDGVRFSREALVRLFSSILRRDEDGYYLVTPHEKVVIRVEDAPFVGVRADRSMNENGPAIVVTTNVGDVVVVDDEHPLRVLHDPATGEPSTYVRIRGGLEARLARPPYYDLVSWSEPDGEGRDLVIRSCGRTFSLGPSE
ncbi:MAG: DUF1285 domain-containing protein [Alphaproteobacteria bacterium]|nr:DUF1285 domain-containing protein [Alphaproteobacteria bacterium]